MHAARFDSPEDAEEADRLDHLMTVAGDQAKEFCHILVEDLAALHAELGRALGPAEPDLERLRRASHGTVALAGTCGLASLTGRARVLQTLLREATDCTGIRTHAQGCREGLEVLIARVRRRMAAP